MTTFFFAPGLRPVIKADRSAAGRKAAYARWGSAGGGDPASTALSRVGIGRSLDESLISGMEDADNHYHADALALVVAQQNWDQPSPQVSEEEFAALAKDGRFTVVYRGGPGGLEQGMVDGTPFIGDGAFGPGTYVTKNIQRAAWFMPGRDGVTESGASIVPMLVPRQITDSAPRGMKSVAFDPVRDHALKGADAINSANFTDDYVIYNTGAVIVGPPITGLSYSDFPFTGSISDAAQSRVDALTKAVEDTQWWALVDGEAIPITVENGKIVGPIRKGSRSDAGRKAAYARWGTGGSGGGNNNDDKGLGIDRADMPQIPMAFRQKFLSELTAEGVKHGDETVDPRDLKQTQSGLNPKQTKVLLDAMRNGTFRDSGHSIIASREGYILDGHHRWDAARKFAAEGGQAKIRITRIDMPIRDLLSRAERFNRENDITARDMDTVTTLKAVSFAFAPGLRPVLKMSRSEAGRYAAGVRWSGSGGSGGGGRGVPGQFTPPGGGTFPRRDRTRTYHRPSGESTADAIEAYDRAVARALTEGDFSGIDVGSSRLARRLGAALGKMDLAIEKIAVKVRLRKPRPGIEESVRNQAIREKYRQKYGYPSWYRET